MNKKQVGEKALPGKPIAKRPPAQAQVQPRPAPPPPPQRSPSHRGRPAQDIDAWPSRPSLPGDGRKEHSNTRLDPSHGRKKRSFEAREEQGKRQSTQKPLEPKRQSSPRQDNSPRKPERERARSPKKTASQDQERKSNAPPRKNTSQNPEQNPSPSRSKSPHRKQGKPKRSHSPRRKNAQQSPSHSYPHNDTRFPPPNTASPNPLQISTKDGDHVTYHLLYENRDPTLSRQAKNFLSAAKAFRHAFPSDLDREALIKTALQERKGMHRISDGPRGNIWRVDGAETQLLACLLGMKEVVVSAKGRKERFDLFGEGLDEAEGDILLISRKVNG